MSAERMPELPRNFLGLPYPKETKKQFNRALDLYEEVQTILEGASNTACPYEHVRRLEWRCTEWEGLASYFEKERFLQISGWMSKFVLPWIREGEKLVNKSLGNLDLNVGLSLSSYQVERLLHTYTVFRIRDSIGDSYAQEVKDETIQEISEGIAGKIENLCPIFSGLRQDNGLSDRLELMTGTLAGTDSYSLLHRKPVFDPNIIDRKLMAALKNLRQSLEGPVAQGKNLGQEKQLVIPVPPEEMRDFVGQRGKILGVIQGGQSWFFRLKGPKGLFGMSIFTGNGDEKIIERRRANAERIAQAAERLPKEFEGAKMPIILEHGTVFKYGWDFVLMELIEGNDLAKIVAKGPFTDQKAIGLVLKISRLAEWIYENYRLVHSDISPENIIAKGRNSGEELFLIDWLDALVEGTGNHCLGKPPFAAPEQRLKEGKIDSRTMVYTLAVLLYFMLIGEGQAVDADGRPLYLSNNLEKRFPGIGGLGWELRELIRECTEVDNKNRPTITELVLKLESLERARNSDQVFQV